jgi:hypothetical protein
MISVENGNRRDGFRQAAHQPDFIGVTLVKPKGIEASASLAAQHGEAKGEPRKDSNLAPILAQVIWRNRTDYNNLTATADSGRRDQVASETAARPRLLRTP